MSESYYRIFSRISPDSSGKGGNSEERLPAGGAFSSTACCGDRRVRCTLAEGRGYTCTACVGVRQRSSQRKSPLSVRVKVLTSSYTRKSHSQRRDLTLDIAVRVRLLRQQNMFRCGHVKLPGADLHILDPAQLKEPDILPHFAVSIEIPGRALKRSLSGMHRVGKPPAFPLA